MNGKATLPSVVWVAIKEFKLSYNNSETILFVVYLEYGNF